MEMYVIHVTKECNCDCLYCYEKDKTSKYTWTSVKKAIDDIIKSNIDKKFNIEFLGGEPMLQFDLIKKSVAYLKSKKGIEVPTFTITTNGTILDDTILNYLKDNKNIIIDMSLDGNINSNQLRIFKISRRNTHDVCVKNLKILIDAIGKERVIVHMVEHLYNVAFLAENVKYLYDIGVRNIGVGTVESTQIIDDCYCNRFISEMSVVSDNIKSGILKGISIGILEGLQPRNDVRTYVKDKLSGKVVFESYGRATDDLTHYHSEKYDIIRCTNKTDVSERIYNIREAAYKYHNK